MDDKETQLKVISLQAAGGDLEKAKENFAWLSESAIEAEVKFRVNRYYEARAQEIVRDTP